MTFLDTILQALLDLRGFLAGYFVPALPTIKFVSFIISAFFLYAIIYLLVKMKWLSSRIDEWTDTFGVASLFHRRSLRIWRDVLKKLHSSDSKDWGKAVIDCDKILGELLLLGGYRGANVHERLMFVEPGTLSNVDALRQAHMFRERIQGDSGFALTKEEAVAIVRTYAFAFRELGFID
ncbi:MAG: hypothetical protein COU07_01565 [Candidatus Harrisonbacteria bacterium CG10_big_fil_rev_8_21_14_0_10_40_38]|uniref:Uncharacterized protein n=1 Tax=Candidatus Harrisonbacteria bacterium CG10_big_fil_rev_8_21_14_0_10_40_38 TaxID=1974583 RepID=A0A2H0UUX4_9BACT|nr:MAG: hypothetical protein COU07_01565 [Candidatus Harrisonbacteria bacterium CG10_big_fil_rev_8_21_14_0_10_40_38]